MHVFPLTAALLLHASASSLQSPEVLIIGRTLSPTPIAADLQELVDGIGGRPTGSSSLDQAIDWAIAKLKAAGLENVTLVANQEGAPYLPDYHAESDTFDNVDLRKLKANTAIAAVLMFSLANSVKAPAPRQSRSEIEALVARTGLDQQMKTYGLWDEFASGERGRPPQK